MTVTIRETICPYCLRWIGISGSQINTHGPAKDGSLTCPGGGEVANDTRRERRVTIGKKKPPHVPAFDERDCSGVFDGTRVVSDADPGL